MERVEMDDGVKQDGYRRILTVDDDVEAKGVSQFFFQIL